MFNPREGMDSLERFEFYYSLNRELLKFNGMLTLIGIIPERTWMNKVCCSLFVIAVSFLVIPECLTMMTQPSSTARILETAGSTLVLVNGISKLVVLHYHRDEIVKQEETWKNLWKETVSSEELSHLCHYAKKGKAMTCNWLFSSFLLAVMYLLAPFVVSLMNNFANRTTLPFLIGIEIESNFILFCTYIAQILATLIIYGTTSGADLVIPVMIFHACGHLKVLQLKLYDIKKHSIMPTKFVSSYNERERILDEMDVAYDLENCIRRHQVILNSCSDIERYFNLMGLIEAVCAVYHLCLAAIGILGVPEETFKFCVQICCAFYHLFIFCSAPDDLMTESAEVANAAFSLPWYYCSKSVQTNVLIMITRAQRSCQWTAGKYFVLSLSAYTTLVYNGISAFAVLRTLM